ncbi:hypothetical protein [Sporolactobacillus laevolacticus]|uniref:Uncharacterized protein n=1 Tax=Sporolactobacillus laevolacticus DSM 442 TaxID=1395513 RepID=V6J7J6_9BACL|nr:hypothetical protein [Sporolactobacillus laevolacticus]EST12754.1 hypothetical protein P343_05685 [Sporolactobacillus laevolacticus DSM 442]MDN3954690.1 hypothetical protein [Sporolactobacillus laevolacticus]
MRNRNNFWSFLVGCGAATAAIFLFRNNQNILPQWAKQSAQQVGKTAQQMTGAFTPQS